MSTYVQFAIRSLRQLLHYLNMKYQNIANQFDPLHRETAAEEEWVQMQEFPEIAWDQTSHHHECPSRLEDPSPYLETTVYTP